MAARVLTEQRLTSAALEILGDWARANSRRIAWKTEAEMVKVTKDAKNLMTLQGNELWINQEAKALKEAMEFCKQVVHELASDSLGIRGTGWAKRFIEMPNGMKFTDQTLLENAVMQGDIERVVRFFAGG
jgi:fructose-specific component phosphotransferase system IIB-like protein